MGLIALTDASIDRLRRDPPLIWRVVAPDDPEMYEAARAEQGAKPTLWSRLFGRRRSPSRPGGPDQQQHPGFELASGEGDRTDLDKAWHGIHYLLTGTAWGGQPPLDFLVAGGREVGSIDVGYGPARVLTAAQTRAARDALAALDEAALAARFDPADMLAKQIYPEIWTRPKDQDDTLGYLMENLRVLRGFLDRTVTAKLGLVVYLS